GAEGRQGSGRSAPEAGVSGRLANADGAGSLPSELAGVHRGEEGARARHGEPDRPRADDGLADAAYQRIDGGRCSGASGWTEHSERRSDNRPGPTNGQWRAADW